MHVIWGSVLPADSRRDVEETALDRGQLGTAHPHAGARAACEFECIRMMLGAARGDEIELIVAGEDAEAAMAEIAQLVETGFGEE